MEIKLTLLFLVLTRCNWSQSSTIRDYLSNYPEDSNYTESYDTSNYTDMYDTDNYTAVDSSNYTYHDYSDTRNNEATSSEDNDNEDVSSNNSFIPLNDGKEEDLNYDQIIDKVEGYIENITESIKMIEVLIKEIKQGTSDELSQAHKIVLYEIAVEDMFAAVTEYLKDTFIKAEKAQNEVNIALTSLNRDSPDQGTDGTRSELVASFHSLSSTIVDHRKTLSDLSQNIDSMREKDNNESVDNDEKPKLTTDEEKLLSEILSHTENKDINNTMNDGTDEFSLDAMGGSNNDLEDKDVNSNIDKLPTNDETEIDRAALNENTNHFSNNALTGDDTDEGSLFDVDLDETTYNQLFEDENTEVPQNENDGVRLIDQLHSGSQYGDAQNANVNKSELINKLKSTLIDQANQMTKEEDEKSNVENIDITNDYDDSNATSIGTMGDGKDPTVTDNYDVEDQEPADTDMYQHKPTQLPFINDDNDEDYSTTASDYNDKKYVGEFSFFNTLNSDSTDESTDNNLPDQEVDGENASVGNEDSSDENSIDYFDQNDASFFDSEETEAKDSSTDYDPFEFVGNDEASAAIQPSDSIGTKGWNHVNGKSSIGTGGWGEDATETDQLSNKVNSLELTNIFGYQGINGNDPKTLLIDNKSFEAFRNNMIDMFENYISRVKENRENQAENIDDDDNTDFAIIPTIGYENPWKVHSEDDVDEDAIWERSKELEFDKNKISISDVNKDQLSLPNMGMDKKDKEHQTKDHGNVFRYDVSSLLIACICLLAVAIFVSFGLVVLKKRRRCRNYSCEQIPYVVMENERPSFCKQARFGKKNDKTKMYDIEV